MPASIQQPRPDRISLRLRDGETEFKVSRHGLNQYARDLLHPPRHQAPREVGVDPRIISRHMGHERWTPAFEGDDLLFAHKDYKPFGNAIQDAQDEESITDWWIKRIDHAYENNPRGLTATFLYSTAAGLVLSHDRIAKLDAKVRAEAQKPDTDEKVLRELVDQRVEAIDAFAGFSNTVLHIAREIGSDATPLEQPTRLMVGRFGKSFGFDLAQDENGYFGMQLDPAINVFDPYGVVNISAVHEEARRTIQIKPPPIPESARGHADHMLKRLGLEKENFSEADLGRSLYREFRSLGMDKDDANELSGNIAHIFSSQSGMDTYRNSYGLELSGAGHLANEGFDRLSDIDNNVRALNTAIDILEQRRNPENAEDVDAMIDLFSEMSRVNAEAVETTMEMPFSAMRAIVDPNTRETNGFVLGEDRTTAMQSIPQGIYLNQKGEDLHDFVRHLQAHGVPMQPYDLMQFQRRNGLGAMGAGAINTDDFLGQFPERADQYIREMSERDGTGIFAVSLAEPTDESVSSGEGITEGAATARHQGVENRELLDAYRRGARPITDESVQVTLQNPGIRVTTPGIDSPRGDSRVTFQSSPDGTSGDWVHEVSQSRDGSVASYPTVAEGGDGKLELLSAVAVNHPNAPDHLTSDRQKVLSQKRTNLSLQAVNPEGYYGGYQGSLSQQIKGAEVDFGSDGWTIDQAGIGDLAGQSFSDEREAQMASEAVRLSYLARGFEDSNLPSFRKDEATGKFTLMESPAGQARLSEMGKKLPQDQEALDRMLSGAQQGRESDVARVDALSSHIGGDGSPLAVSMRSSEEGRKSLANMTTLRSQRTPQGDIDNRPQVATTPPGGTSSPPPTPLPGSST